MYSETEQKKMRIAAHYVAMALELFAAAACIKSNMSIVAKLITVSSALAGARWNAKKGTKEMELETKL